jgi:hypothetical protein
MAQGAIMQGAAMATNVTAAWIAALAGEDALQRIDFPPSLDRLCNRATASHFSEKGIIGNLLCVHIAN